MRRILLLLSLLAISCSGTSWQPSDPPLASPVPDAAQFEAWLGSAEGGGVERPEFFVQMADPQLGMFGSPLWLALFGATWNDDDFEVDAALFEMAIAHANRLAPAFVVICGDLVNRAGHPGQIAEFRRIAAQLDPSISLYLVAGNHDVENTPTAKALKDYREIFGPDWYSFRSGSVHGIVLNSQLIDAPGDVPEEAERQLAWLRSELARAQSAGARHIIVFQHHPFFLTSPDEGGQYFNIARGTRAIYLDLFKQAGVEAVFAGHYHRNAHGWDEGLEMITSGPVGRPLGGDPSGLRIVKLGKDSLEHEYFALRRR